MRMPVSRYDDDRTILVPRRLATSLHHQSAADIHRIQ